MQRTKRWEVFEYFAESQCSHISFVSTGRVFYILLASRANGWDNSDKPNVGINVARSQKSFKSSHCPLMLQHLKFVQELQETSWEVPHNHLTSSYFPHFELSLQVLENTHTFLYTIFAPLSWGLEQLSPSIVWSFIPHLWNLSLHIISSETFCQSRDLGASLSFTLTPKIQMLKSSSHPDFRLVGSNTWRLLWFLRYGWTLYSWSTLWSKI